jgi:hypothetical protein
MPVTPRLRMLHRQMYIDLIRAHLREEGTQAELARALGVTEAYLSFAMEPVRPLPTRTAKAPVRRHEAVWVDIADLPLAHVREELKVLKTPSAERARQIATYLALTDEPRDRLLSHADMARGGDFAASPLQPLGSAELRPALRTVGDAHQLGLYSTNADDARRAYGRVWLLARDLLNRIAPQTHAVEYAQTLMFAHDAAQVLNHHELALFYARRASLVLTEQNARSEDALRLRLNALLAEVVTLNSLGLRRDALGLAQRAREAPNYLVEPRTWTRSFLEEELTAMVRDPRIYDAEKTANNALDIIAGESIHETTIRLKLMEIYLSRGTARSLRRAKALAEQIDPSPATAGASLRQVRAFRALALYHRAVGDIAHARACVHQGREVAEAAGLSHQLVRLTRAGV